MPFLFSYFLQANTLFKDYPKTLARFTRSPSEKNKKSSCIKPLIKPT